MKRSQFADVSHVQQEMLKRLGEHFGNWLNPV
jgi:hypothetical protein